MKTKSYSSSVAYRWAARISFSVPTITFVTFPSSFPSSSTIHATNFVARFFHTSVKIHLPFCRHREPTERLSSGQWSFSRWLVNRQNTRLDNCGDRTLVRLITLHYKCIKLESNYKRARDRVSRRNLAKWLQVNASLSARNLKAMRDCRWSKANRKSENRSYTSLYLHVRTLHTSQLIEKCGGGWINPIRWRIRETESFICNNNCARERVNHCESARQESQRSS